MLPEPVDSAWLDEPVRPAKSSPTPAGQGQHLLIVEDEPRLRQYLVEASREFGVVPHAVRSSELARTHLAEHPVDLLILDLNLPGESGLSLLRGIRAGGGKAPAIFLTGYGTLDAARHAITLDAVSFLLKPCTLEDLEQAIARGMRRLDPDPSPIARDVFDSTAEPCDDDPIDPIDPVDPQAGELLEDLERRAILAAVDRHDGNRAAAARELGISERKLYYKLKLFKQQ